MYRPTLVLSWQAVPIAAREIVIEGMLSTLADWNSVVMARHHVPPLYAGSIRYQDDPPDARIDEYRDCLAVARLGHGDCDDLVPYRIAELRLKGIAAEPVAFRVSDSELYHTVIRYSNGALEDPSKILGMT